MAMTAERRLRDELDEALTRIRFLERAIGASWEPPARFGLTGCEAKILGMLIKNPVVSHRKFEVLESGTCLKVHIHRMRRKLAPHGIAIRNRFGIGYFLTDDDKARLS